MTVNGIRALLIAFFAMVLALFVFAPFMTDYGTVDGLEGGHPVEPDFFDLWGELNPAAGSVYGLGDILCHQDSSRSFHLNGSQLPVCVRDLSALAGLAGGLVLCAVCGGHLRRYAYVMLAASFSLMIADVIIQNAFDLNVSVMRILTGAFCGVSVSVAIDRWLRSFSDPRFRRQSTEPRRG